MDVAPITPFLLLAAFVLLSASAAPLLRREAALAITAATLLAFVAGLVLKQFALSPTYLMLGSGLAALPLLDRARMRSLALTAAAIALIGLQLLGSWRGYLSALPDGALIPAAILCAVTASYVGSLWLGLHRARFTPQGQARLQEKPPAILFAGWSLLAVAILLMSIGARHAPLTSSLWLTPAIAALIVIAFAHRRADALAKVGEALCAGVIIKSAFALSLDEAVVLGVIAGVCVLKGEAAAIAVRVDDPPQAIGAVLLPALLALLALGFHDSLHVADALQFLGEALGLGIALGIVVCTAAMLLLGFKRAEA